MRVRLVIVIGILGAFVGAVPDARAQLQTHQYVCQVEYAEANAGGFPNQVRGSGTCVGTDARVAAVTIVQGHGWHTGCPASFTMGLRIEGHHEFLARWSQTAVPPLAATNPGVEVPQPTVGTVVGAGPFASVTGTSVGLAMVRCDPATPVFPATESQRGVVVFHLTVT